MKSIVQIRDLYQGAIRSLVDKRKSPPLEPEEEEEEEAAEAPRGETPTPGGQ